MSAPLLIEHLLDTTAYSIDHVEVYQGSTQTFIAEVSSDNFKSLILNSKNKMPSLHIGDCRHVGYNIIFSSPQKEFFRFYIPSIRSEHSSCGYSRRRYCCSSCSSIKNL